MPGGRRNPGGRSNNSSRSQLNSSGGSYGGNGGPNSLGGVDDKKINENWSSRPLAPKHVPIPVVPVDGQLSFEALSLGISTVAVGLQLLNLYRTVWWLPQSYNEYTMNFYLIDPYLLVFIGTMLVRRLVYALLRKLVDATAPTRWLPTAQRVMRVCLLLVVISVLCWCLYYMSENHNSMKVFYLCYPSISIYFLMFGVSIGPFFDISTAPLYIKEDRKTKFVLDKPLHNCSLSASAIRAEVLSLRSDFNRRLKRALFASSGTAYVCGIAPIIFVPPHLHFNVSWVVQHIVLFWLGRLSAHFAQAYPVRYCDVLHRAALHLGRWTKVEGRNNHIPTQLWNDAVLWPHGSLVKHNKELYRSDGLCTAAEPGNSSHYRFHALFSNPTMLICSLLGLQLSLVVVQLLVLLRTIEWYQVLSMTLLLVTNYYTLFKLARDYLVCWKVYRAEQLVQEKTQAAINNIAQ
ncbi:transmembrane protein 39A isoform X1 [Neodiprion pinetum]|uniref:Transmembrane protein 39A n=1 Tax=Neodiprion lecontei TaxID=441921 RepID=A0A6J0BD62_NEOLC|nr:transmembrane protein 39A [Neodiprion lecontei]XP_046478733.1 transmembrane protein 39A [Neodiprion pinetum]XP_046478734.1 transmembrane protein 39A [Neodiprion pinetum]XP_046478735.1 transmembrane protein 39A [Neodiprion pinetum]XP_046593676.1 transmembrane protein 39A [Neodiprion lecontei]XP_046593677.1 transmembrane protein 39A [Neodiprion lecontei]